MNCLALGIFLFAFVQLAIAFINLVKWPGLNVPLEKGNELVSILIPVRNEERTIHNLLDDLIQQSYRNIEILVFDDESEDNSAAVVDEFSIRDPRIRLISSTGLPQGWLGKMHACHTLSMNARGEYFLFLDADVRIQYYAIPKAVSYLKSKSLGLLSVFPKQIMKTTGEWFTVPTMNYILLSLLPLVLVRTSGFSSITAANGQFKLFAASVYNTLLPHEKMKANRVEDISISRMYKQNKIPIACLVGDDSIQCRMYGSFCDAVHGFSKNVIAFFGNSFILALLFWLVTTFGFIIVFILLPVKVFLLYLIILLLPRAIISVISHQNIMLNLFFIIPQQFSLGIFIYRAFINAFSGKYQWKGRTI